MAQPHRSIIRCNFFFRLFILLRMLPQQPALYFVQWMHVCSFRSWVNVFVFVCVCELMGNFVIKFFGRMVCGESVGGLVKFSGILSGRVLMIVMILFLNKSSLIPCCNVFSLSKFASVPCQQPRPPAYAYELGHHVLLYYNFSISGSIAAT